MKDYKVWVEGASAQGGTNKAQFLGSYKADNFKQACKIAMKDNGWDMDKYYDEKKNTFWACKFHDNEKLARKAFG